jgi:hypothetical protein
MTDEHATTTHAGFGEGNPRLVFVVGSDDWDGEPAREFPLDREIVRIGSAPDTDLTLEGLDPLHAEIRHDDNDEYVVFAFGDAQLSSDHESGGVEGGHVLRTGSRVELGDWAMTFSRDEFADHGRPFGGRQGGEGEHQQRQAPREQAEAAAGDAPDASASQ